jgi:hypothetical protein
MNLRTVTGFLLSAFILLSAVTAHATNVSETLNQVQQYLRQKDHQAARSLLTDALKSNRSEYKLWLALGYVYESEQNYDMALKAFRFASELKTSIPGLSERIIRLQELVKANAKEISGSNNDQQNQTLLEKARYLLAFNKELEGYQTFYEAVEADRSILSNDFGFISKGLEFFKKNQSLPDAMFFLGAFTYYSGQYEKASVLLENFISSSEESPRQEDAKRLLAESREILKMAFTAEPALKNKPAQTSVEQKVDTTSSQQIKEIEIPETETFQENFDSSSGESFAINLARQRALKLLEEYDQETDSQKKLQIIWRLGLLRLPLPEVMAKMAEFLSTNDIQTVVSALRALVKIGNPGAQICGPDIINLLGNDEFVIKWSAITALENLPILPGRAIPRLFKIYRNEKRAARQGIIIRTLNGYGPTGIAVLQKMLEDATGPNKRPIAEVISILTGENVETILRDS